MKKLRVFTWHIHGSYLYYLSHADIEFIIPKKKFPEEGYIGKTTSFPWGENVIEIPFEEVKNCQFDCILFQSKKNYIIDQYEIFSDSQRLIPKVYIEHDPPRESPTETHHFLSDKNILLVHVTHFNNLMWDSGLTPTTVIDHGVTVPDNVGYTGKKAKGIIVINNIKSRGRRLGYDIFKKVRSEIPLDIVGMGSETVGGLGNIPHNRLPYFLSDYRFFFSPIRYTSLGLSIIEAMMIGLPVVGLATTELPTVIRNDHSGYISTNLDTLIEYMQTLIKNPQKAAHLGQAAKTDAEQRFSIKRFAKNWKRVLLSFTQQHTSQSLQEEGVLL